MLTIEHARETIASLAEREGNTIFAREVLAGCWDSRSDVQSVLAGTFRPRKIRGEVIVIYNVVWTDASGQERRITGVWETVFACALQLLRQSLVSAVRIVRLSAQGGRELETLVLELS